jgi:hypothetical protein
VLDFSITKNALQCARLTAAFPIQISPKPKKYYSRAPACSILISSFRQNSLHASNYGRDLKPGFPFSKWIIDFIRYAKILIDLGMEVTAAVAGRDCADEKQEGPFPFSFEHSLRVKFQGGAGDFGRRLAAHAGVG